MTQTRYIVFERPEGSKCWTVAYTLLDAPMVYGRASDADLAAEYVRAHHRGYLAGVPNQTPMRAHVATVELPE